MPKLTDKERLDRQLGKHKPVKHEDARLPLRARVLGNNYGPSSSYTPATDGAGYEVPDRSDSYPDPVED